MRRAGSAGARQVARPAGEQRSRLVQRSSSVGGGEQRERGRRPARWPAAGHRGAGRSPATSAAFSALSAKSRPHGLGAPTNSATAGARASCASGGRGRGRAAQRWHGDSLAAQRKGCPARDEQRQPRAPLSSSATRRRPQHVLEVVEHQQQMAVEQRRFAASGRAPRARRPAGPARGQARQGPGAGR